MPHTSRPHPTAPVVQRPDDLQSEEWRDPLRGHVRFATHFSADRTPTDSMVAGRADIPPGGQFGRHRHPPAEIYHVLEGTGIVHLDGDEQAIAPGDAVFVPGGCQHGLVNTGTVPLRLFYVLAADAFDDVAYDFAE
jgi:quercetin dioxygenase-like cupin family protein